MDNFEELAIHAKDDRKMPEHDATYSGVRLMIIVQANEVQHLSVCFHIFFRQRGKVA